MATQISKKLDQATRDYIEQAVERKVMALARDPDWGLELRPEFIKELEKRSRSKKFVSHEKVWKKFS